MKLLSLLCLPALPLLAGEQTDFVTAPNYSDAPETKTRPGVPRGKVHEFIMKSNDSRIYPGDAKGKKGTVPYQRKVWVYIPEQYKKDDAAPLLVAQDGGSAPRLRCPLPAHLSPASSSSLRQTPAFPISGDAPISASAMPSVAATTTP